MQYYHMVLLLDKTVDSELFSIWPSVKSYSFFQNTVYPRVINLCIEGTCFDTHSILECASMQLSAVRHLKIPQSPVSVTPPLLYAARQFLELLQSRTPVNLVCVMSRTGKVP